MIGLSAHPWMSGLFGDDEIAAIFAPEAELQRLIKIEAAWTRALGEIAGAADAVAIAENVANTIQTTSITPESLKDRFAQDGVVIPALVEQLKLHVGADRADWVHKGLTSQDVMDTSLMLALIKVLAVFANRLASLDRQLVDQQGQHEQCKLMAYTRMQPALETSATDVIGRWRQPLPRLQRDLAAAALDIRQIQWGGPIGAREHPQAAILGAAFANQLDLNDPGMAWHTDRTSVLNVGHVLTRISTVTGKIGEDIALMAAIGPEQCVLSGGGSSAMAHKNNPVKAEVLISLSNYAATLQTSLTQAARHEGFRSGQAWMLEWITFPQLCCATGAGLLQSTGLVESLERVGRA